MIEQIVEYNKKFVEKKGYAFSTIRICACCSR